MASCGAKNLSGMVVQGPIQREGTRPAVLKLGQPSKSQRSPLSIQILCLTPEPGQIYLMGSRNVQVPKLHAGDAKSVDWI